MLYLEMYTCEGESDLPSVTQSNQVLLNDTEAGKTTHV